MNHRRTETGKLKTLLKNIFLIGHTGVQSPLTPQALDLENEDHNYSDYIRYYQQATRWK